MSIEPAGRKLLRIEARNSQTPIERKPEWIKTRANMGPEYTKLRSLVAAEGLHTVCQEADVQIFSNVGKIEKQLF